MREPVRDTRESPRFELRFSLTQGTFTVAPDLDISARAVALFGPSGSGKTSILEAVAGLRTPQEGRIAVRERVLFDSETHTNVAVRERHLGYVPQDLLLFPHLDVRQNITYAPPRRSDLDVPNLTHLLGLTPLMDRKVSGLSGGERQRVALARALHSGPDVLLLDEPLAAVDLARRRLILETLVTIRDDLGVPLIYVTHSPDEARAVADYAIVLEEGRVVAAGPPVDVLP
ncbi:MAG TPA: ATP-binding cassette domain-containing protein [Vicinamibacterales bacterium]|jgi:molybdate transport system ATP-binding protein|nr:ATP-binding cassette domain-containing protein [Vicinamibacterales bacterium]